MSKPLLVEGGRYQDARGTLKYNNDFDASPIKRVYTVSNSQDAPVRGWQGHKIESRWFTCTQGSYNLYVIEIDNWDTPSRNLLKQRYKVASDTLDIVYVPPGFITCIEMLREDTVAIVMSDYKLGEVNDEYRFDLAYFKNNNG